MPEYAKDFDRAAQLAGALQATLAGASFPLAPQVEAQIREQVCEYADDLKERGLPPERIIIAVKYVSTKAGLRPSSRLAGTAPTLHARDKLLADMVRWCIERYFVAEPEPVH